MKFVASIALAAALFMFANPALAAEVFCAPRAVLVEKLQNDYAEAPVAHGLTNANDRLLELFASKDGETWTLLLTYPNGQSCAFIAGHTWRAVMSKLLKPTGQPI